MDDSWVKSYFFIVFILLLHSGCTNFDFEEEGMSPVYQSYDDMSNIRSSSPILFKALGKIVASGNFIFINEINKGIHVINNTNPAAPQTQYFWHILGNKEFTINQNVLYADNGKHLLVIDISKYDNIKLIKYIANQYQSNPVQIAPLDYKGWFECYDINKGILIGWEKKLLQSPACKKN